MKKVLLLMSLLMLCLHSWQPQESSADTVLLSRGAGGFGFGYGFSRWSNFTAVLDAATGNQVTVADDFTDLSQMLNYDALFLDQRDDDGSLAALEVSNLSVFAATGRKIVMVGENQSWSTWNSQLMEITGGSYVGDQFDGVVSVVAANDLTAGAPTLDLQVAGVANGGTALYNQNFATLWGNNVLTVLDVNLWDDQTWDLNNSDVFGNNVANWLADSNAVPEPCGTGSLLAAALLFTSRRRRAMMV